MLDSATSAGLYDTALLEYRSTTTVELWLWSIEEAVPSSNTVLLKIIAPQVSDEVTVYISSACKCLRVETLKDPLSALVTSPVNNLAIPAFLGVSLSENWGKLGVILSY